MRLVILNVISGNENLSILSIKIIAFRNCTLYLRTLLIKYANRRYVIHLANKSPISGVPT